MTKFTSVINTITIHKTTYINSNVISIHISSQQIFIRWPTWTVIQSEPPSLRPYAKYLPSSENEVVLMEIVPSGHSLFGSRNSLASSSRLDCLYRTLTHTHHTLLYFHDKTSLTKFNSFKCLKGYLLHNSGYALHRSWKHTKHYTVFIPVSISTQNITITKEMAEL